MSKSSYKSFRTKLMRLIEEMNLSEKLFFGLFFLVFLSTSLLLLRNVSNLLSKEIPVSGGIIHEGVIGYPRTINPLLPLTDSGRDLSKLIYSGLMKVSSSGELIPDLAKEYNVSDDGLTYTFTLKDKIFFHDGTPVTAYDVEFTIKKVIDPIIKSPLAANWDGVSVRVIDDKTISFSIHKPYSPFIENTTLGILPMHIWKDVGSDAFLWSEFNIEPVGSGPYEIKEIKRNTSGLPTYYHLKSFSKYSLGRPYIDDVFVHFFTSEDQLINAYENGEISSMSSISPLHAKGINQNKSNIIETSLPRYYAVFLNQNQSKVLSDLSVRRALRLATPIESIVSEVLSGFATPIQSPLPADISLMQRQDETYEERLESAKSILEKSGWNITGTTTEANIRTKKSKGSAEETLSFSLSIPDVPELKQTAELLKASWQAIGVSVDIKIYDASDLEQNVIVPRSFDSLLFGEVVGRNIDLFPFWASSERNYPGQNIVQYANTKADRYLSDARASNDYEKRLKLYQSFENEIYNDIPALFLYSPDLIYIVPKQLKGVKIERINGTSERFSNINTWYIDTEKVWSLPWQNNKN